MPMRAPDRVIGNETSGCGLFLLPAGEKSAEAG